MSTQARQQALERLAALARDEHNALVAGDAAAFLATGAQLERATDALREQLDDSSLPLSPLEQALVSIVQRFTRASRLWLEVRTRPVPELTALLRRCPPTGLDRCA